MAGSARMEWVRGPVGAAVAALAVMAGAAGCADIRNEIDAERGVRPGALSSPAPTPSYSASSTPTPEFEGGPAPWADQGPGPCLASGVSVSHGPVNAALGERAVDITLTNCGNKPYRVHGYPEIGALDGSREPLAMKVIHGGAYTDASRVEAPGELTLAPGESALSVLHWDSRITGTVTPPEGAYVVVAATKGAERSTLPMPLDVGTSGELDVTAWAPGPAAEPS
ncbi:DUF4232 domain-containing protein [Streptomyces odonnellii]|uniref:DUF4232 domain-containing protein n=1 Tax=Streptomyces odonnellii TaxID=1417980 RepID=UPI000ABF522B|nr:DUF4232 domain-containing protein [Streptomyces odonnellii]